MKILITGHAGFLGSNLTLNFLKKNNTVVGLDTKKINSFSNYKNFFQYKINLLNRRKVFTLLKKMKNIDIVIHVAAKQPMKKDFELDKYLETNFYGTKNLLESCEKQKINKIIFCSSFSVYGNKKSPIKEIASLSPRNTYGLSKCLAENLLEYFSKKFNFKVIILRFDGIYGNRQNLPGFIKMSFNSAISNKKILLFNMGKLKRDNIYVKDAVKAIDLTSKKINKFKFEVFNIGGNNPTSSLNIFKKIKKICNSNSKIFFSKKKLNFSQDTFLSINKAKKLLRFKPDTLDNNLKKMFLDAQ
jgi:nucleoside-diphosphate-sugar epimerase